MARPAKDKMTINRSLFADIYDDCCKNDAERMILDIIISEFILKEVFRGDEATERAIAKVTGLSKSGVRVVQGRAMKKLKDSLAKGGIHKVGDVVDSDSRSAVAAKGNNNVDEASCNENIYEGTSLDDFKHMSQKQFIQHLNDIAEYLDYALQGDDYDEREELIDTVADLAMKLERYKGWTK